MFFDDPFNLRIDIVVQILMLIFTSLVILDDFVLHTLIVNRISIFGFFFCYLLLCGGNIMIFKARFAITTKAYTQLFICEQEMQTNNTISEEMISNMEDYDFKLLFRAFSINLQRVDYFDSFVKFLELENKGHVTLHDMNDLNLNYIYALSLDATLTNQFQVDLAYLQINFDETLPFSVCLQDIFTDILRTNYLSFLLLQGTDEYGHWKHVSEIHELNNIS